MKNILLLISKSSQRYSMDILYSFTLCPFSRKVRIFLNEKKIRFNLIEENPWKKREDFIKINSVCQVPVLIRGKNILADSNAICEYVEEAHDDDNSTKLIGRSIEKRAEVRRLITWFDHKFYNEVTKYIVNEKIAKYYEKNLSPDSRFIHAAKHNLLHHIRYIEYLIKNNIWLSSCEFTLADITLASHISVLDYMDFFPWSTSIIIKDWYSLIKSRPCFQSILQDKILGFTPPIHYTELDF